MNLVQLFEFVWRRTCLNQADFCISYALQLGKAACDKVQKLFLRANDDDEDAWHGAFKIYAAIQHHSTISDHFCTTLYMFQSSERSWACDDEHWKRFSILKARFQALRMQRWISAINEDVPACVKICGMWASDCGKSPTGLLSDCSLSFLTDSSPIPYWFLCRGASFLYSDRRRSKRRRDRYFLPLSVAEEIIAEQRQLTEATCDAQLCAAFAF